MNSQLKPILLKEVKEVLGRRDYLFTILLNIIIFLGVGYVFVGRFYEVETIRKLFMELSFIMIPPFAMWIVSFPFIQEKFGDEKLIRRFEAILTTPISLKTIWASKMMAIFLLSYPTVIFIVAMFSIIWNFLGGLNPFLVLSTPVWVMALIITPLIPMIYAAFSSWSILRFTHPWLMQILQFFAIGISVLAFLSSGKIVEVVTSEHVVNWLIVAYSSIGIIAAASLVLFLIHRLDKEKVTV
jgi:ABC-type Na+ efflux pump permease subunit